MTESWKSSRVISTNPDPDSGSESDSDLNNSNFSVCVQKPEDFGPFIVPFLPSEEIASVTAAAAGLKKEEGSIISRTISRLPHQQHH